MLKNAQPALPSVRNEADQPIFDNTAKPVQTPKRAASGKLDECKRHTSLESKSTKSCSKSIVEHLVSLTTSLDFIPGMPTLTSRLRPTYHSKKCYEITATGMSAASCLPTPEAGVKLIHSSIILTFWAYRIKQHGLPTLLPARKQPLPLDRLISLNLHNGNLNTWLWFGISCSLPLINYSVQPPLIVSFAVFFRQSKKSYLGT